MCRPFQDNRKNQGVDETTTNDFSSLQFTEKVDVRSNRSTKNSNTVSGEYCLSQTDRQSSPFQNQKAKNYLTNKQLSSNQKKYLGITPEQLHEKILDSSIGDKNENTNNNSDIDRGSQQKQYLSKQIKPSKSCNNLIIENQTQQLQILQQQYQKQNCDAKTEQYLSKDSRQSFDNVLLGQSNYNYQQCSSTKNGCCTSNQLNSLQNSIKCREHKDNYSLFCLTDKKLCCLDCVYKEEQHKKHSIVPLKNAIQIIKEETQSFKAKSKELVANMEEAIRNTSQNKIFLEANFTNYKTIVQQEFQQIMNAISKKQDEILDYINDFFQNKIKEVDIKYNNMHFLKGCLKEFKDFEQNQKSTSQIEGYVYIYSVQSMLQNTLANFNINTSTMTIDDLLHFDFQNKGNLLYEVENFGKIRQKNSSYRSFGQALQPNKINMMTNSKSQSNLRDIVQQSQQQQQQLQKSSSKKKATPLKEFSELLNQKSNQNSFIINNNGVNNNNIGCGSSNNNNINYQCQLQLSPISTKENKPNNLFETNKSQSNQFAFNLQQQQQLQQREKQQQLLQQQLANNNNVVNSNNQPQYIQKSASQKKIKPSSNQSNSFQLIQNSISSQIRNLKEDQQVAPQISNIKNNQQLKEAIEKQMMIQLFYDSQIFTSNFKNPKVFQVLPNDIQSTQLLYRLSQDGASSQAFHQKCDNQGPIIMFIKANDCIFGYFMPIDFVMAERYFTCEKCYIFSIKNKYQTDPLKFEVKSDKKFIALYQSTKSPCLGSTLLGKQDLWIKYIFINYYQNQYINNCKNKSFDNMEKSCSCLGYAYHYDLTYDSSTILAGSYNNWNIEEIEVFKINFLLN